MRDFLKFSTLAFLAFCFTACSDENKEDTTVAPYRIEVDGQISEMMGADLPSFTINGVAKSSVSYSIIAPSGEKISTGAALDLEEGLLSAALGATVNAIGDVTEGNESSAINFISEAKLEYEWEAPEVNLTIKYSPSSQKITAEAIVTKEVVRSPIDPDNLECTDTDFSQMFAVGGPGSMLGWDLSSEKTNIPREGDTFIYKKTFTGVQSHYASFKFLNSPYWADAEWAAIKNDDTFRKEWLSSEVSTGAELMFEIDLEYRKIDVELDAEGNKISEESTVCGPDETGDVTLRFMTDDEVTTMSKPIFDMDLTLDALNRKAYVVVRVTQGVGAE
ncbi:hypothetical protein [Persicobacter diffluens]|uniref:Uncharacterized protein n=1 Tax=Persicobacter diffluens TaxID=981 RepID=A0AAN4W3S5_9BACT|nr:hypothetical protein PEDI_49060 [Persicobacter diffluens]